MIGENAKPHHPRIVVIGAGFAGMQTAQSLVSSQARICLIDCNNYHTFIPLLYQVATAQLEPEKIAYPIRTLFRKARNFHFLMAEVQRVDLAAKSLQTNLGQITYDYLVIATGSKTKYLGVAGANEYAFPMRTLAESIQLRNQILNCFEQADQETDPLERRKLLTFVIVGGGATGVELAGALVELIKSPLKRDYPHLDMREVQIFMIQSGERPLVNLPAKLGDYTARKLRNLGVKIHLNTRVNNLSPDTVELSDGQIISTATVIWAAGVEASAPKLSPEIPVAEKEKLVVEPTLQLQNHPQVYAIGDVAFATSEGKPLTGVAPEALQQGVTVARNLKLQLQGKSPQPFKYFNKGRLAIIGRFSGVGKIGKFSFGGFLGWLMWLGVHVTYLPGFRNRLLVIISWFHTYLFRDRAVRQILATPKNR